MSDDLLHQDDIKAAVRSAYTAIPTGGGDAVTRRSYRPQELEMLPNGAISWALGVGNPFPYAEIQPGETVLDIGSGAGIDTIIAAKLVGPDGRALGLDMLDEMIDRARAHAQEAGVDAEFIQGEMEAIPLPDATIDVVISNGVINLSPRKSRVLAEIFRVLKPGGRMCIVDLTVDEDLPAPVLTSPAAWAGCVSGALSERVFRRKLDKVGFDDVWIGNPVAFGLREAALYPLFTPALLDEMRQQLPADRHDDVATSVIVKAKKQS